MIGCNQFYFNHATMAEAVQMYLAHIMSTAPLVTDVKTEYIAGTLTFVVTTKSEDPQ